VDGWAVIQDVVALPGAKPNRIKPMRPALRGGPMAASLRIAPADLTRIAARNGGKFPFLEVQKIISGEQRGPATHGAREMPVWGPIFSEVSWDQDLGRVRIYSLAIYLEAIQVK
jgi:hypothetical protein